MTETLRIGEEERQGRGAELLEEAVKTDIVVYEVLSPKNKDAAREAFLADDSMDVPPFEYDIDESAIRRNIETIARVRGEAESTPLSHEEEIAIIVLCNESAKKNAFVRDCLDYRAAETPEGKEAATEMHRFSGEALYGNPDKGIFCSLLRAELAKIDLEALSPEDRKMYDSLLEDIGELEDSGEEPFRPSPETVKKFSEMVNTLFEGIFKHIPEDKDEFTTEEACEIVNEIIREEIGEDATEYRAVMSDTASACSVNHIERKIIFPVRRASGNFTRMGLKQIIVHELCTHVYRAMVYEKDELSALSHEIMPGFEETEEGVAKCCEQAVVGKYKESGVEHYINIGLATFKGKSFREVFEIQRKLMYLKGCRVDRPETPEEKDARFHSKDKEIFTRTTRCFRGTGELPNCKDLVYYNGSMKVWKYIEEHIDDPDLLDQLFLSGKTDILSKDQERLIYEKKIKAPAEI